MRCSYDAINVSTQRGKKERNGTTREHKHKKTINYATNEQVPEKATDSSTTVSPLRGEEEKDRQWRAGGSPIDGDREMDAVSLCGH